ncbi:hypothetical protein VB773_04250 [Haloarculaceae archaeon H-GB2-1]|nr:hypothetical protein [Haloarculaceae archaeon H-GB1-1]MEA5388810.1 hypothetical protein [Haloarculaceae archaeon H-GB11]MEA5406867.1 hypothetical protein [Haloarculaceae archaeon H-GB2-1]
MLLSTFSALSRTIVDRASLVRPADVPVDIGVDVVSVEVEETVSVALFDLCPTARDVDVANVFSASNSLSEPGPRAVPSLGDSSKLDFRERRGATDVLSRRLPHAL